MKPTTPGARIEAVLRGYPGRGSGKLVLVGIASHDGEGGSYPSIDTLALYASVDRRNARKAVAALAAEGWVEVVVNGGGSRQTRDDQRPNLYVIDYDRLTALIADAEREGATDPPSNACAGAPASPTGGRSRPRGGAPASPELEVNGTGERDTPPVAADAAPDKYADAKALVDPWWEERRDAGNPVGQPYMACVKVVHSMLRNKVAPHRIEFGLRNTQVVSTGALELTIQRELERRGERGGAPVASTRERRLASRPGEASRFAEALGIDTPPSAPAGALPAGDDDQ